MSTEKASKKRWTKQEFIEIVDPCNYRFRIWWFFLWHRYVTVKSLVAIYMTSDVDRLWAIRNLDFETYINHAVDVSDYISFLWPDVIGEKYAKIAIRSIREELKNRK